MQSRNSRDTVDLNDIFLSDSQPAKFPFNYYTASTSVFDPEVNNTQ